MGELLRFLSVVIGVGGILGFILLIVGAQPSSSYGEVNLTLVAYGIAVGVSGLFWALLGGAVANMLRTVERLDKENAEQGKDQTEERTVSQTRSKPQSKPKPQSQNAGHSDGIAVPLVIFIVVAVVLLLASTA